MPEPRLEEWHKEVPFTQLRMVSRAGANRIDRCNSLGWTPDRVWSDDVSRSRHFVVIPADDCRDAGAVVEDARAEAGIQSRHQWN